MAKAIDWDLILQEYGARTGLVEFPKGPRFTGSASYLLQSSMIGHPWTTTRPQEVPSELQNRVNDLISTIKSLRRELASCRNQINGLCADLKARPFIKQAELFDIGERFELIHPIPIVLEESEDEVVASFPETETFAVGSTESEAIMNLKSAITELYSDLSETPHEQLGRLPLSWLRTLKRIMRPVGES